MNIKKTEQSEKMQGRNSFFKYYISHFGAVFAILLGLVIGYSVAEKQFSVGFFMIACIISLLFPVLAWCMKGNSKNRDV